MISKAFELPNAVKDKAKPTDIVILPAGNLAILQLVKVHPGDIKDINDVQKEKFLNQVRTRFAILDYEAYTDLLMDQTEVVIH